MEDIFLLLFYHVCHMITKKSNLTCVKCYFASLGVDFALLFVCICIHNTSKGNEPDKLLQSNEPVFVFVQNSSAGPVQEKHHVLQIQMQIQIQIQNSSLEKASRPA